MDQHRFFVLFGREHTDALPNTQAVNQDFVRIYIQPLLHFALYVDDFV